jgi:hypothetical protein
MTRRPGDNEPEPSGGRAAERLREFIGQRFPGGLPPSQTAREEDDPVHEGEQDEDRGADEERRNP